jgi:hypothetical protein
MSVSLRQRLRRSGSIAIVLFAAGALAAPAPAGQPKFASKVTIEFAGGEWRAKRVDAFQGTVSSTKPACVPNRKVVLYRQKNANSEPKKVGSDRTDSDGNWGVEASPQGQFSFARVKREDIPAGRCLGDRSKKIEFPV